MRFASIALACLWAAGWACAHPEFQKYLAQNAPRHTDCAMCHRHPDGPEGPKPGQVGSLEPAEVAQLQRARAAFEPGQTVHNPLLNGFGNEIVRKLGKRKVLELRRDPAGLAEALGREGDIDGDGAPDSDEYLAGTHPVNAQSGPPWTLFIHNLKTYRASILLLVVATFSGLYGLNNLLKWFEMRGTATESTTDDEEAAEAAAPSLITRSRV